MCLLAAATFRIDVASAVFNLASDQGVRHIADRATTKTNVPPTALPRHFTTRKFRKSVA